MKHLTKQLYVIAIALFSVLNFTSCEDDATASNTIEGNTVTMRNTFNDAHVDEISFASYLDYAFMGSDVEFPDALQADLSASDGPMINSLYAINFKANSIEYTLLPDADDEFWKTNYRTLEAGVKDRYYLTFATPHNVASFTATDTAINVRIDSENVLVVEVGEGFVFLPGASFSIALEAENTSEAAIPEGVSITMRNTFNDAHVEEISFSSYLDYAFGSALGEDGLDVTSKVVYEGVNLGEAGLDIATTVSASDVEFPEALKADLANNGAFVVNGLYSIDITEDAINYELIASENDPFWVAKYRVLEEGVYDRYYLTFAQPHGVKSFTTSDAAINLRIDSDHILVVEVRAGFDFKPGASFSISLN